MTSHQKRSCWLYYRLLGRRFLNTGDRGWVRNFALRVTARRAIFSNSPFRRKSRHDKERPVISSQQAISSQPAVSPCCEEITGLSLSWRLLRRKGLLLKKALFFFGDLSSLSQWLGFANKANQSDETNESAQTSYQPGQASEPSFFVMATLAPEGAVAKESTLLFW
jgi:hypothetical protein